MIYILSIYYDYIILERLYHNLLILPPMSTNNKNKTKRLTYLIRSDNFDIPTVNDLFDQKHWVKYKKPYNQNRNRRKPGRSNGKKEYIDFLYVDGKYTYTDKFLWTVNTGIYNVLDTTKSVISNKWNLYKNMTESYPEISRKYMIPHVVIDLKDAKSGYRNFLSKYEKLFTSAESDNSNDASSPRVWIVKPVHGWKGKGVFVTDKFSVFSKKVKPYKFVKNKRELTEWVVSPYIMNPLLITNRKFHIRMYLMYYKPKRGKPQAVLFNEGVILRAKDEYKQANYSNPDIHDTHFIPDFELMFPVDFMKEYGKDKTMSTMEQMLEISKYVAQLLVDNKVSCYQYNENCYEVFGLDFMLTDDFQVKIIECNAHPGFSQFPEYLTKFFINIMNVVVEDVYPGSVPENIKEQRYYYKVL